MEESENDHSGRCFGKHQHVEYREKSGKCNVCSAPCSSCFHNDKVPIKLGDESSGENYAANSDIGQLSSMAGVVSTSDSFSETALVKGSTGASNESALCDSVPLSETERRKHRELHDDCLSGISGNDENATKKCHLDVGSGKFSKQSTGECAEKMPLSISPSGLYSLDSNSDIIPVRVSDEAMKLQNLHDTSKQHDQPQKALIEDKRISDVPMGELLHTVVPIDAGLGDIPATTSTSIEKKGDMHMEIHHVDETEDSDIMEQDVKVCDICGDAGREDLLAICFRCSDGAEHTYCMREMLAKVPEGDWLCEECNNLEKATSESAKVNERMAEDEKKNSSDRTSGEYLNSTDVEGQKKNSNSRVPSKRPREDTDAEVSSKLKKPATGSAVGSSKTFSLSNPAAAATLSQATFSRVLEKDKHLASAEPIQLKETTESTSSASESRQNKLRGSLLKSNSFNTQNSKPKPKPKPVDQAVIQRQKSVKENVSGRHNDDDIKSVGRSASFKLTNSVRTEPKVKMLSSRPSDILLMKNKRQKTAFDRQHSFKAEPVSASKIDKKPATSGDSSSVAYRQETNSSQTDSVTAALSRASSLQAQRAVDLSLSGGDVRRPTSYANISHGVSSGSGINKIEKRSYQSPLSADVGAPDGLARDPDSTDSADQTKEYSGSRLSRSSAKPSKDETPDVRAAIEAAFLKKPSTYLRNRNVGQSDGSTTLSTAGSFGRKKIPSVSEQTKISGASKNLTADCIKQEAVNNLNKQSSVVAIKDRTSAGQHYACATNSCRDHCFMKNMAFPEHESIWHGSFEISRSGKGVDLWDGIQAHLSSAASPKVIKAVEKFESRITLAEVPRLSSWPKQFQEYGAREDNIALFFFAKDLESFNKIYKVALYKMMKEDLALKGNIDGVELLIFPSNQLPDNSQKWNTLFYLWGVFRSKKGSCPLPKREMSNQLSTYQGAPPNSVKPIPDDRSSIMATTDVSIECKDSIPVLGASSEELQPPKSTGRETGVEVSHLDLPDDKMTSSRQVELQSPKATDNERGVEVSPIDLSDDKTNSSCHVELHELQSQKVTDKEVGVEVSPLDLSDDKTNISCQAEKEEKCVEVSPVDLSDYKTNSSCHVEMQSPKAIEKEGGVEVSPLDLSDDKRTSSCQAELQSLKATDKEKVAEVSPIDLSDDKMNSSCQVDSAACSQEVTATLPVNLDASSNSEMLPHCAIESVDTASGAESGGGNALNSNQNIRIDAGEPSTIQNSAKKCGRFLADLNADPVLCLSDDDEPVISGTGELLPSTTYDNNALGKGPLSSNRVEPLDPERFFFTIKPQQPSKGISLADEHSISERPPILELALGTERKRSRQGVWPLINEEPVKDEGSSQAESDLSLSLSFPFPEKKPKPAAKAERLFPDTLFGNLRGK